jgi:CRP-like cAMP-binding protein
LNIDPGPRVPVSDGIRERLLGLSAFGLLTDIDDDAATLLTEHSRIATFDAGDHVVGRSGVLDSVYIVLEGSVRVGVEEGPTITVGPGRPVGLIGVLTGVARSPVLVAERATRALEIPHDVLLAALEQNFSLWRSALRLMAGALIDVRGELPLATTSAVHDPGVGPRRSRTLVERALAITNVGIFVGANVDAVFDLARVMREIYVPAGRVFWRRGEAADAAIRIVSGSVRCVGARGEARVVGRDSLLGTIEAAAHRPHGYEAQAETDVCAYQIAFDDWLVVLEAHPELAMRLLAFMAAMLGQALAAKPA